MNNFEENEFEKAVQEFKKLDIKSMKEVRFLDFFSTPKDLNINASKEELIDISKRHNNKIASKYIDDLERAKEVMADLDKKVFKYDSTLSEYKLLHRQLIQIKTIYRRALSIKIDKGVGIYGKVSPLILNSYKSYNDYINQIISLLEDYIIVIGQQVEKKEVNPEEKRIFPISEKNGFLSGINEKELKTIFNQLVFNRFISPETNETDFTKAFSGMPLDEDFKQIKWIDVSKTRNETNAQTLFEFLFLLKMPQETYITNANKPHNFYRKIESIFGVIKNLTVKNPQRSTQKTERHKILKFIIESSKLN